MSSAITHTENSNTVTIMVGSPKPSSPMSAGTTAVSGELSKMFTHIPYVSLRERILCNDIAPGTPLMMREVANEYDASDIPIREALRG